jgi:hypothetical protein
LGKVSKTYKGSATDFKKPNKPSLPKLLGFHQTRVRVRATGGKMI